MDEDEKQVLRSARDHFLASGHIDAVAKYQREGRALRNVPDAQLIDDYVSAFTEWSRDIDDDERSTRMSAHMAELTLRNIALPDERVRGAMELVAKRLAEKLKQADPEALLLLGKQLLDSYQDDTSKPQ